MKPASSALTRFARCSTTAIRFGCSSRPGRTPTSVVERLHALGEITVLTGDSRDPDAVEQLLTGCDAALHTAGVVGTDNRQAKLMWEINANATENVLTRAVDLGLDPVVSVGS